VKGDIWHLRASKDTCLSAYVLRAHLEGNMLMVLIGRNTDPRILMTWRTDDYMRDDPGWHEAKECTNGK